MLLALTLLVGADAKALGYCSPPSAPFCVSLLDSNSSASDFEFCRFQIRQFQDELKDYVRCVTNDAVDESNKVVEQYNCKARGDSFCL